MKWKSLGRDWSDVLARDSVLNESKSDGARSHRHTAYVHGILIAYTHKY